MSDYTACPDDPVFEEFFVLNCGNCKSCDPENANLGCKTDDSVGCIEYPDQECKKCIGGECKFLSGPKTCGNGTCDGQGNCRM